MDIDTSTHLAGERSGAAPARHTHRSSARERRGFRGANRRGIATIWGIASIGLLLTITAVVVDGALMYTSHADLQIAADSAALASVSGLTFDPDTARARAVEYASKNLAAGEAVEIRTEDIEIGKWDTDTRTFTPLAGEEEFTGDAVRVTAGLTEARGNALRMAFAQIFGESTADVEASAIATFRPRDIVLVLDLSGSMNFDSQIRHIPFLGQIAVEANLYEIWQDLGGQTYGNLQFNPTFISTLDDNWVLYQTGLWNVPYPYPGGSWLDYINYVQGDSALAAQGYERRYGMLTFMNYLLDRRRSAAETPDLWQASAQPITAVKDSVDIFLDFVQTNATEDRVGLAIYTSPNGGGLLEHALTDDIAAVRTLTRRRQAGHYHGSTNIGAGLQEARLELEANGRNGTLKTIVLLTDGIANLPGSASDARSFALDQAQAAADAGCVIAAISLGSNVDMDLMEQIATITDGIHFHVPGGQSVADYEADLVEVFRHIARERPLQLVN
jgi:Flp pilus assembly protein TadG/uncharacterized protein YegL